MVLVQHFVKCPLFLDSGTITIIIDTLHTAEHQMSTRSYPYSIKPPEDWSSMKAELETAKLLVVSRTGPTVLTVQDDNLNNFKVILGNPHTCSCSASSNAAICVHKLYCIIKVLRVPIEHPLAWQKCYSDSELDQV